MALHFLPLAFSSTDSKTCSSRVTWFSVSSRCVSNASFNSSCEAALPKMAKAASHEELKEAFETHLEETENHVTRLEQVFESVDEKAKGKKCKAMQGLVEEGQERISE